MLPERKVHLLFRHYQLMQHMLMSSFHKASTWLGPSVEFKTCLYIDDLEYILMTLSVSLPEKNNLKPFVLLLSFLKVWLTQNCGKFSAVSCDV